MPPCDFSSTPCLSTRILSLSGRKETESDIRLWVAWLDRVAVDMTFLLTGVTRSDCSELILSYRRGKRARDLIFSLTDSTW